MQTVVRIAHAHRRLLLDHLAPLAHSRVHEAPPIGVLAYTGPSVPAPGVPVSIGDYVKLVSPAATRRGGAAAAPKRSFDPPRAPPGPPPGPDSPGSAFGIPGSGGAGGVVFVVAALVGMLSIIRPRWLARVAELVETPLVFRPTLSLAQPG